MENPLTMQESPTGDSGESPEPNPAPEDTFGEAEGGKNAGLGDATVEGCPSCPVTDLHSE